MNFEKKTNKGIFISRWPLVFTLFAMFATIGYFMPANPLLANIYLIVFLGLNLGLAISMPGVKQPGELSGLPFFLMLLTSSRTLFSIWTTREIVHQSGRLSSIVQWVGEKIIDDKIIMWSLIGFGVSVVSAFFTFLGSGAIRQKSLRYSKLILPAKLIGLEADITSGNINKKHAQLISDRIQNEIKYYFGITGSGLMMILDSISTVTVFMICLVFAAKSGLETTLGKIMVAQGIGLLCILIISETIMTAVTNYTTTRNEFDISINSHKKHDKDKQFSDVLNDAQPQNEYELLNPGFDKVSETLEKSQNIKEKYTDAEFANVDIEFKQEIHENADKYFDALIKKIWKLDKKEILLCGDNAESIPVTVPVNIAIRLSQEGEKCLLIDLDEDRKALREVFDITTSATEPVASCIENTWIQEGYKNKLKEEILEVFDYIILYGPGVSPESIMAEERGVISFFSRSQKSIDFTKRCGNLVEENFITFQQPLC